MTTKIIATIGPRTETPAKLGALFGAGADIVRVNFSHANRDQYRRIKQIIDRFNKKGEEKAQLMLDLQGPRLRVGRLPEKNIILHDGELYRFSYSLKPYGTDGIIPIDNQQLVRDIKINDPMFLCNGDIELLVEAKKDGIISARVINGGVLSSHKGINVPKTRVKQGGLTVKDMKDLKFGLSVGLDYVALSFVQTAQDVLRVRRLLGAKSQVKIVAKIERPIALKNIDKIIAAADLIMVARGDLGIEVPIEDLPIIQKNLVRHAHWHNKPAIIATQVMTSMIRNPHPTRAEISDIANAVFDGADMVMLSDETAVGDYPIEAVRILRKVLDRTERYINKGNLII